MTWVMFKLSANYAWHPLHKIIFVHIPVLYTRFDFTRQITDAQFTKHEFILDITYNNPDRCGWITFYLEPLSPTWINFNSSMIITRPVKCGIKLFIHSKTLTVAPLNFGHGKVLPKLYKGCNYLNMLGQSSSMLAKGHQVHNAQPGDIHSGFFDKNCR